MSAPARPRALAFIDDAAALLEARGWTVSVDTLCDDGGLVVLFAYGRSWDSMISLGAFRTSRGDWKFDGLRVRDYKGQQYRRARTYSDARIALGVYATDYPALDARRAARMVTA